MARAVRRLLCFLTCMRMRTRRCLPIIAQPGDKAMAVVQYVHKRNSLADVDETGDSQASATSLHAVLLALLLRRSKSRASRHLYIQLYM